MTITRWSRALARGYELATNEKPLIGGVERIGNFGDGNVIAGSRHPGCAVRAGRYQAISRVAGTGRTGSHFGTHDDGAHVCVCDVGVVRVTALYLPQR